MRKRSIIAIIAGIALVATGLFYVCGKVLNRDSTEVALETLDKSPPAAGGALERIAEKYKK